MAAVVPSRVRRGTTADYYYFDGVHEMTILGSGIGDILNNTSGLNVPLVTLSTTDFDALQSYLQGRDIFFAGQIADAVG